MHSINGERPLPMPVGKTYDVPVTSPDRFYLGGEWVTPCSADLIDVIQPPPRRSGSASPRRARRTCARAVAAARQAFDQGPWPRMTHAERAEYLRAIAAEACAAGRGPRPDLAARVRRAARHRPAAPRPALPGTFEYYAGLADTFPFEEPATPHGRRVRPARPRAGRRGRRDHPVERADRADRQQDRARRCSPGCTVVLKVVAGGAGSRATCSPRPPRRSACRRACSTS